MLVNEHAPKLIEVKRIFFAEMIEKNFAEIEDAPIFATRLKQMERWSRG